MIFVYMCFHDKGHGGNMFFINVFLDVDLYKTIKVKFF